MKTGQFLIVCGIFLAATSHASAFPWRVSCDAELDDLNNPIIQTVVSSRTVKAIIVFKEINAIAGGIESPVVSFGSFYLDGFVSVVNNPARFTAASRVFSEKTGFRLNAREGGDLHPSIAWSPLPGHVTVFVLEESNERNILGADMLFPFFEFFSSELLVESSFASGDPLEHETPWFFDGPILEGETLHNVSLKLKTEFDPVAFVLGGGCSLNGTYLPGYFGMFHADLDTKSFDASFLMSYQSKYYFSPRGEHPPESFHVGSVLKWRAAPWLSIKANGAFRRTQTGALPFTVPEDRLEGRGAASVTVPVAGPGSLELEASFSCIGRWEAIPPKRDFSVGADAKWRATPNRVLQVAYAGTFGDADGEHEFSIRHKVEVDFFELTSRLKYSLPKNMFDFLFQMAITIGGYRVKTDVETTFIDCRPSGTRPFRLKMGLEYAM